MEEKKLVIAQDNVITKSRYKFDVIEKRCIYQIIYMIRKNYIENNNGNKTIFNNLDITLTPKQLDDCIEGRDNRNKVYKSLKTLNHKQMEFENSDEWFVCHFINYARHNKKTNLYEVEVSKLILPYLVELADNFTTLDLTVALTFGSRYTQRFYEFCCMYKKRNTNYFFLDLEELRKMLGLENKYKRFFDFKKNVIEIAQKEMKNSFDEGVAELYFSWKENENIKDRLDFFIIQKTDKQTEQINYSASNMALNSICNILSTFFPRDKKYIKRVQAAIQLNPQLAIEIKDKLDKKVLDYNKKDIPPIIRFVLSEDYGIK